jgi:hypothetical protein
MNQAAFCDARPKEARCRRDEELVEQGEMAGWTGLEPAAFAVTGRRDNQLHHHPRITILNVLSAEVNVRSVISGVWRRQNTCAINSKHSSKKPNPPPKQ